LSALRTGRLYPQEYPCTHFESTPGIWTCRMPWKKSPVTRPEIDPWTFRLVAQRLNHYAAPSPNLGWGKRLLQNRPHRYGGSYQTSYSLGTGLHSLGKSGRSMKFTTHFHLLPRLRMSGAVLLLPLHAFMTWTGTFLLCTSHLVCWKLCCSFCQRGLCPTVLRIYLVHI
jgi:hypothetical protein